MRNTVTVCLYAFLLVLFVASAAAGQRQSETDRLLAERAVHVEKLDQPQSAVLRASLLNRIRKIDNRLRELGFDLATLPPLPAPPAAKLAEQSSPPPAPASQMPAEEAEGPVPVNEPSVSAVGGEELDRAVTRPQPQSMPGGRYQIGFEITPWFRSNYFQSVADSPSEAVAGTELSGEVRVVLAGSADRRLVAGGSVNRNIVRGVADGHWNLFDATLLYQAGKHEFGVRGYYIPQRLTFITASDEPGYVRVAGLGAEYNGRPTRRTRTRLLYRREQNRFADFTERTANAHRVGGEVRHRFHNLFMPGVGLEWTRTRANSENFDYREITPAFLYGMRLGSRVSANLRYRFRMRDYPIADPLAENFDRRDRRHDFSMYVNTRLSRQWDLVVFGGYLRNQSTRASRIFSDANGGATLRFRFSSE